MTPCLRMQRLNCVMAAPRRGLTVESVEREPLPAADSRPLFVEGLGADVPVGAGLTRVVVAAGVNRCAEVCDAVLEEPPHAASEPTASDIVASAARRPVTALFSWCLASLSLLARASVCGLPATQNKRLTRIIATRGSPIKAARPRSAWLERSELRAARTAASCCGWINAPRELRERQIAAAMAR